MSLEEIYLLQPSQFYPSAYKFKLFNFYLCYLGVFGICKGLTTPPHLPNSPPRMFLQHILN